MKGPPNPERSFGVSVGVVLCVIAAFLLWRGRVTRAEIVGGIATAEGSFATSQSPSW